MEQIKDFRRKQGNLELFFLSLVRADSKEKVNFLIDYGRTLLLGGKDYAGVDEIDLEAEIAGNADRLEVIRQFARDGLKSPKSINVFNLPKIKKMMDSGVVNSHEVTLLQVISDSLVSTMENNKTLFKSLIKKYTEQDETGTGDNEPQQGGIGIKDIQEESNTKKFKKANFRDCIQYKDKEKLIKRLHELIDGKKGRDVGYVLLKCRMDGLITRNPTKDEMNAEFPSVVYKSGVKNYLTEGSLSDNGKLSKASQIVIFDN